MNLRIIKLGNDAPVAYAVEELVKYLGLIDESIQLDILKASVYDAAWKNVLWVGLDPAFADKLPAVENKEADDAILIDIAGSVGIITGTNGRSVLTAVYRLLGELGCAWVRPGRDGEIIPRKKLGPFTVRICEKASYRHRGICIEGAVSYGHVADMVEWMPKVGMNAYFNQFMVPFTFYDRWYSHISNPYLEQVPTTVEEVSLMTAQCEDEIKKRGLMYHIAGHGWTCNPFGIEGNSWDVKDYYIPEESKHLLALVNGKRELWGGIPLNTNLCYSNPKVRDGITDAIADFCAEHGNVDYLHFWLADGYNNHCECPGCRDTQPSDFYVMMLNSLDTKLTERGIRTKIVFLVYFDLLWAPVKERLVNQDRFVLMFAPITRTYSQAYKASEAGCGDAAGGIGPYVRNRLVMPRTIGENLSYLKSWQKDFSGDSFDFDYHFMWDHLRDPGYYSIAEILSEDMKNLKAIGLNGLVSCQVQRSFFPTGLGMCVMAGTLWNDGADFERITEKYFKDAYGTDGGAVQAYLKKLSALFDPPYLRLEKEIVDDELSLRFRSIPAYVKDFGTIIERNLASVAHPNVRKSWEYLKYHGEICVKLSAVLAQKAGGSHEAALKEWEELKEYVRKHEPELHHVFDVFIFIRTLERVIKATVRPNAFH